MADRIIHPTRQVPPISSAPVVVIGGGLAGLAAAAALSSRDVPVVLLESRNRLGGRASSFVDSTTGETLDNCQHVSLGCGTNLQHLCRLTETADAFRIDRTLTFIARDGRRNTLRAAPLPAPAHLLPAFARLSYLSLRDKWRLAWGLRGLARAPADVSGSMRDWLVAHRQTPAAIERFWHVVLVSALSAPLDRIDVRHARHVLVDAFLSNRTGWEMQVPTVPLDDLYTRGIGGWLQRQGGDVRLSAAVRRITGGGAVTGVELRDGTHVAAQSVICTVPPHHVANLLDPDQAARLPVAEWERIASSPIASVHLWFDRPLTDLPHAVLIDRLSHWVFRRPAAETANPSAGDVESRAYYQVVISAAGELERRPAADVIAEVAAELREVWPAAADARLLHARLVIERRAVFEPRPGVEALRPSQRTVIPGLTLAGDWTQTGWPGTMEGAVRSGYLAAEAVLADLGRPERVRPPDLPVAPLARWLLGIRPAPER